jgi:signal transduction histidine kinase
VYCGAGAFAAVIVGVSLAQGGSWLPLTVQIPLALATLWPWVPGLRQKWFSAAFVVMSLVPTAILTWTGGSPLLFGLMALSASRVANGANLPKSIGYGLSAIAIVLVRPMLGHPTNWMLWKVYVELGLAMGWAMRSQRQLVARNKQVTREQARLAAFDERRRIARDVHDVLAHTLTIMMVHLNSARLQVREDPEGTAEVLDEVAQYGRVCLEEIRRTVGLLSEPRESSLGGPIETAHTIEDLAASYRKVGADINLRLDVEMAHMGRLAQAAREVWSTSYRIVQESLANAVKHAPGAAIDIRMHIDDAGLHLRCANALRPGVVTLGLPSGGNGLPGMAERVRAVGGEFDAGPDGVSEWVVRADMPLGARGDGREVKPRPAPSLGRAS